MQKRRRGQKAEKALPEFRGVWLVSKRGLGLEGAWLVRVGGASTCGGEARL